MIGKKAGMTRIFDSSGMSVPVTAISITPNHVSQIKTLENDGYRAIQVSYGEKKETRVNKPITGHYKKVNLKPGEGLVEFSLQWPNDEGAGVRPLPHTRRFTISMRASSCRYP